MFKVWISFENKKTGDKYLSFTRAKRKRIILLVFLIKRKNETKH